MRSKGGEDIERTSPKGENKSWGGEQEYKNGKRPVLRKMPANAYLPGERRFKKVFGLKKEAQKREARRKRTKSESAGIPYGGRGGLEKKSAL